MFNQNDKSKKEKFYNITLKDGKLKTELQIKDDITNFNNKRYMIDNLKANHIK